MISEVHLLENHCVFDVKLAYVWGGENNRQHNLTYNINSLKQQAASLNTSFFDPLTTKSKSIPPWEGFIRTQDFNQLKNGLLLNVI